MKKLLFAILIIFGSCAEKEDLYEPKTGFILRVKSQSQLSSGQVVTENTNGNFLMIYNSDQKKFDGKKYRMENSKYLYDEISNQSYEYDYILTGGTMNLEIMPGKYYFYIQMGHENMLRRTGGEVVIEKDKMPVYEILIPANSTPANWFDWNPEIKY